MDAEGRTQLPLAHEDDLCVARVPLFRGLSHADQREVAAVARPTRVSRDEIIYPAGSDLGQLLVVHTGRVKISRVGRDGHEQIIRVLEPGDFVGESAFLGGGRSDHQASALEAGSMCVFRHADLGRLLAAHPSVGLRMLQDVSRRLEETEARLAAATTGDVSSRVAGYLLSLPGRRGEGGAHGTLEVTLPLTKKDIASLLDTTPESLSRALRRLSDSEVIDQPSGSRVSLLDVDALVTLADGD